jgi:hypothetical protein
LLDGVLKLYVATDDELRRIHDLMNQYADMSLDLADASLISAAERLNERRLFSMDQSLRAVRIHSGQFFEFVP